MLSQRVCAVVLAALCWTPLAVCKDMAVVSNKSNSLSSIAMPELVRICKGQNNRWPDGRPVTFVTRDPASPEMRLVLEKVYSMTPDAVSVLVSAANHGRANHPAIVVVNSDEIVVKRVETIPGAVGLVDVYSITSGVDVVRVGGKLPLEPGYPLHGN